MMLEENIKMSLEDYPRFVNDSDPELGIAKALFLSTRPNTHGFNLSEEVLKKWSSTILGKFLVGNLNPLGTDVMSHERKPDIFGYVPENQGIEFIRAKDGYLDAYVNIVVSKIYATEVYSLFLDDNFRNVSVEMRVLYSNDSKDVAEFHIAGLTVLGKTVNPSVPQAHIEMVRFSADEAEKYYCEHVKCSIDVETEVLRKLNAIYNKLNLKEEETNNKQQTEDKMAKLEEKEKDIVMDKPTDVASDTEEKEDVKLSDTEDAKKDEDNKDEEAENKMAEDSEDSDSEKKEDDDNKAKEEKASNDSEEKDDKEENDKEAKCAELEAKCAKLEAKLSELEKFKADTEEEKKMAIVTQTFAQYKESIKEEDYAKFEEKAKNCTLETINAWKNEVLASIVPVLMSKQKDESHLRMEDVQATPEKIGLWDRI